MLSSLSTGTDSPVPPARRRAALCLAAALLLAQLPACATDASHRGQLEMSIIDRENGQTLTTYRKDGRSYVAGRPASRYAIRLANRSGARLLAVLSVDGINAVSGETAAVGQTGYVLDPWQSYDIDGWRKSDTAVAAFVFAALGDSYAARTGRPDNVGVIGVAVFMEKPAPHATLPRQGPPTAADGPRSAEETASRHDAAKARSGSGPGSGSLLGSAALPATPAARSADSLAEADAAAPSAAARLQRFERLGTAHGQREWSVSRRTTFERLSSAPQDLIEIAYDSHANLVLSGVIPAPIARARPFPIDSGDDPRGFVPDPPVR